MDTATEHVDTPESPGFDVKFRDPPAEEDLAPALRLEIARTLVGAPHLPIELPAFGMRLLTVEADRRGVDLVLGFEDPVARLRLEAVKGLASYPSPGAPVSVSVKHVNTAAERIADALATMAERVRKAATPERWEAAWSTAQQLAALPSGVPLTYFRQVVAGIDNDRATGLVRTGFRCNQDCGMCWQSRDWGRYGPDQIIRWIEDLRAAGVRRLSISGGEPTLDAQLPRYLSHARDIGFEHLVIETNAIQLAKPGLARRLADAGLANAFVSLHSADAATSDLITRAPGTHERTIRGVRALIDAGVKVVFNAVMTRQGLDELEALPGFLHREFAGAFDSLMISYPTLPYEPALLPTIIPEPARLRTVLKATLARAFALGVPVQGLDGPCGPPLCAFGADRRITDLGPVPELVSFRSHVPACDRCAVKSACLGVRKIDVELFGEACVAPLDHAPAVIDA